MSFCYTVKRAETHLLTCLMFGNVFKQENNSKAHERKSCN